MLKKLSVVRSVRKIIWCDDDDKFYKATIFTPQKIIYVIFCSGQKRKTFKLP